MGGAVVVVRVWGVTLSYTMYYCSRKVDGST